MIKIELIGKIGKDAIIQTIKGKDYAKFSLAITLDKEHTEWVDCLKIDKEHNLTPYLTVGKTIYVEGKPYANAYTNKEGKAIPSLTVWINELEFISSPKDSTQKPYPEENHTEKPYPENKSIQSGTQNTLDPLVFNDLPF
jgi:single-strand DNA-binding protein